MHGLEYNAGVFNRCLYWTERSHAGAIRYGGDFVLLAPGQEHCRFLIPNLTEIPGPCKTAGHVPEIRGVNRCTAFQSVDTICIDCEFDGRHVEFRSTAVART